MTALDRIWKNIKLLILDVDGVLSDGQIYLTDQHEEIKAFHVHDGQGIRLLLNANIDVAVITARKSVIVENRMHALGVKYIYQGNLQKLGAYEDIKNKLGLMDEEIAHVGDDWPDLPLLKRVGLPIAVNNAMEEVLNIAKYITQKTGGTGAVREVANKLLHAKGCYEEQLQKYLQ